MADIMVRSTALETMFIPGGGKAGAASQFSALGERASACRAAFPGCGRPAEFTHDQLERAGVHASNLAIAALPRAI